MSVRMRFLVALGVTAFLLFVVCTVRLGATFAGGYDCTPPTFIEDDTGHAKMYEPMHCE